MRVLHVINSLAGGGAEKLLVDLLPRLRERGLVAELLLLSGPSSELAYRLFHAGVPIRYSGAGRLYSPRQVWVIRGRLQSFDIVHAHLFPALLWTAMAIGRLPGKAAIYTEHSTTNRRRNSGLLRLVDYWAYDRYARIVCISQGVKQRLVGHLGGIGQKAVVIHNGIDLGRFTAGSAPGKLVVCVANLLPYKGQEVLLRALSLLPEEVRVELAGRGPLEQRLRELAAELGLRERVRFLGYVQEVTTLYRTASICVVPSLWEGFSLAAVEAMASGVPVVASGVPGLAEVVGEAGLLFEAGNPQDLAEKISALLCSPELWAEKRAQGLERAREFSIERTAGEYCRLYAEVAGARS